MQVTKAEACVLNSLAREYREGLCGEDFIAFLECAYLVWFDHFPAPHIPDDDAHEIQWRLDNCKKVFRICKRGEVTNYLFASENLPTPSVESLDKHGC
jgi:hypothetical protein